MSAIVHINEPGAAIPSGGAFDRVVDFRGGCAYREGYVYEVLGGTVERVTVRLRRAKTDPGGCPAVRSCPKYTDILVTTKDYLYGQKDAETDQGLYSCRNIPISKSVVCGDGFFYGRLYLPIDEYSSRCLVRQGAVSVRTGFESYINLPTPPEKVGDIDLLDSRGYVILADYEFVEYNKFNVELPSTYRDIVTGQTTSTIYIDSVTGNPNGIQLNLMTKMELFSIKVS